MELFGSFAFFGGALFGGLGLLLYRTLGLPWRLGYRHLIGALCLAVWLAVFWTRPYQPLGLLAVASAALWAMRRGPPAHLGGGAADHGAPVAAQVRHHHHDRHAGAVVRHVPGCRRAAVRAPQ
ncbi:hypothetical protein L564_3274 [Bordetella pertussis CHLA-15]|nr:hypothetical protein L564_3274 [Bordetella pertussis CHLA-15]